MYEHSIKLLRRFVPEEALPELTVDNIQALLQKLDSGAVHMPETPAPSAIATLSVDEGAGAPGHGDLVGNNDPAAADQQPPLLRKPATGEANPNQPSQTPGPTAAAGSPGGGDAGPSHSRRPLGSSSSDGTQANEQANHTSKTPAAVAAAPAAAALPTSGAETGLVPGEPVGSHDVMEADEHPLLQEELGCLLLDSMGKYRSS